MKLKLFIAMTLSALISACGFHLRSQQDWPANLHNLYVTGSNLAFTNQLKSQLKSLNVTLDKNSKNKLILTNYTDNQSSNTNINTNEPNLNSYQLSITATLYHNNKQVSANSFTASADSIQQSNSIRKLRPSNTTISLLQENLLQQIYFWIKSTEINQKQPA